MSEAPTRGRYAAGGDGRRVDRAELENSPTAWWERRLRIRWSKLYSLVLDGFVIYDSRVSAAMATLVERCKQTNLRVTPKPLSYVRMPAKGGPNLPNSSDRQRAEVAIA